jgi:hypothetical protein
MRALKINKYFKILFLTIIIAASCYLFLGYLSSYIGWYGYEKWRYRVATSDIEESRNRGVFVKKLDFKIEGFSGIINDFTPYIEKGFKYGRHSSEVTMPITGTEFPYQLCFNIKASEKIGLLISEEEVKKFDSANNVEGYLKTPYLRDTIIVSIAGKNIHAGIIKVW